MGGNTHPIPVPLPESLRRFGHYPIEVNAVFANQYMIRVLHSRGPDDSGCHFLTWLAKDIKTSTYVCLKIWAQDIDPTRQRSLGDSTEHSLPKFLLGTMLEGSQFVHIPLREFTVNGPGGQHLCQVYPLYGRDFGSCDWPLGLLRRFARDGLEALEFLHENGVCHGYLDRSSFVIYPQLDEKNDVVVLLTFDAPKHTDEDHFRDGARALNTTSTANEIADIRQPYRIKLQGFRNGKVIPSADHR
jgi:hypothetical protein